MTMHIRVCSVGKKKYLTMNLNEHQGWVFIYWDEFPNQDKPKDIEIDGTKEEA